MPRPLQLPDFGELMKSFEAVANSNAADDQYVYVKRGRVHTENRPRHWFTSTRRKAKTAQWLQRALKVRYGHDIGNPLANSIDRFSQGEHQLKVGDLRRLFVEGQSKVLAQVAQTLAEKDDALGDALAPLTQRINQDRVVTAHDMGEVIAKKFGQQASFLVVAANKDARLSALPELMNEASRKAQRLSELPEPVVQSLIDFCARGSTKAALTSVLNERFDFASEDIQAGVGADVNALPDGGVTQEAALEILHKARKYMNRREFDRFMAEVKDPLACTIAGIDKMRAKGLEFTPEVRREAERLLQDAKPASQAIRQAAADARKAVVGENGQVPEDYQAFERTEIGDMALKKKTSEADVAALKTLLETRLRRETDFDYAVSYEIARHDDWTQEQKDLYRSTMAFARDKAQGEDLFLHPKCVSDVVAQVLSNEGITSLSMIEDKAAFLKAITFTGHAVAPRILEHMAEVSAAFREDGATAEQLFAILFGEDFEKPDLQVRLDLVQNRFFWAQYDYCNRIFEENWVVTDAMRAQARKEAVEAHPGIENDPQALAHETELCLNSMHDQRSTLMATAAMSGLKIEAALAQVKDTRRDLGLDAFVKPPILSHSGHYTVADVEACWLSDFVRQRAGTTVAVLQADGEYLKVNNSRNGLPPDELQNFLQGGKTKRHSDVMDSLKKLCGTEKQYVMAMLALSQSGPVSVWKEYGALVDGALNVEYEHSALEYLFTKRKNGNVAVDFKSPDGPGTAKLSGTVIIRPDGSAYFEALTVKPVEVPAVKPVEVPAAE